MTDLIRASEVAKMIGPLLRNMVKILGLSDVVLLP